MAATREILGLSLLASLLVLPAGGCKKSSGANSPDEYAAPPPADMSVDADADPVAELDRLEGQMRRLGMRPGKGKRRNRSDREKSGEAGGATAATTKNDSADDEAREPLQEEVDKGESPSGGGDASFDGEIDAAPEDAPAPAPASQAEAFGAENLAGQNQCSSVCTLSSSICELEVRICTLADEHEGDPAYADACERAIDDCEVSSDACERCG